VGSRYVALVRGINVGRAKRVAMADLRSLLEELGCRDVRTLLNSGNVVFTSDRRAPARIADQIEGSMLSRLGVRGRVIVLPQSEFATAVDENSLAAVASDPTRLLVAFCQDTDRFQKLKRLEREDWGPDALATGSKTAYVWCASGILGSELLAAVGRTLGDSTTTRNWATVMKINAELQALSKSRDGGRRPKG